MKLAVLISGSGSNLQAFIDASNTGLLQADIALVLSNKPDALGLQRASQAGIATAVVDHRNYPQREDFDQAMLDAMAPHQVDLVILAGFMRILTPLFLAAFRGRLLNIHPSLLPKYPGLHTHQRAIDAGDACAGATVHFVTEELDGGPPVLHAPVAISPQDTAASLAARVQSREHRIYPLAAQWFVEGRLLLSDGAALLDGEVLPPQGLNLDEIDAGQAD
ncbi:MAG: phosphoribosylglycinamide formyltransferase [Halieaceae bacterium]